MRRPRQDSNLRTCLRRAVLYPLSYGGQGLVKLYRTEPAGPVLRADRPVRGNST